MVIYKLVNIKNEIGIEELYTFILNELILEIITGDSFLDQRFLYSKKKIEEKKIKYYEFDNIKNLF